jgi:cytochrome c peroxidase
MHIASLRSLREVVEFFDEGGRVPVPGFVGHNELEPLGLTEQQVDDLVAFLEALDGEGPPAALLTAP